MRLDIEALRVLNVVVQEGSFAKAAAKLHKAQSAISYQIKKLEDNLGMVIFDRSQYRAALTPAGRALWSEGRRMLQLASRIETLAERYGEGWEPRLDLVIDGALPLAPIMTALKVIADRKIPTLIQVKTEFLGGVPMRFDQEQADMMLAIEYQPSPLLKTIALPATRMVLVAAGHHPLAGQTELELSQLYDFIELTIHDSSDPDKKQLDSLQFGGERVYFLSDFRSKKEALLMGLGFGWMPDFLIERELNSGELVELDYQGGSSHAVTPQLVYPSDRPLGKAGQLIAELIMREFAPLRQPGPER